jgi:hypothetical protein
MYTERNIIKCSNCRRQFSTKTGTIFADKNISLRTWFKAIPLFFQKSGISSIDLGQQLCVSQGTAYKILRTFRKTLKHHFHGKVLSGMIEVDETWISPDTNKDLRIDKDSIANKKKVVVSLNQREVKESYEEMEKAGRKKRKVIEPAQIIMVVIGNNDTVVNSRNLMRCILDHVEENSTIVTDGHEGYNHVDICYNHVRNPHSYWEDIIKNDDTPGRRRKQKFVDYKELPDGTTDIVHSNGVESNFKHLKRLIAGAYIHFEYRNTQLYLWEYCYRYNLRHLTLLQRFDNLLSLCCNEV